MSELYMYLSGDPEVNRSVFAEQHSILGDREYAGEPFERALQYCLGGYEGDYNIVLKMQKELEKYVPVKVHIRRTVKSFAGSHPNVPAFVAGSPKAMYRQERAMEKKFCTVYFNLACPAQTTHSAIINRGALALSLVKLLESQGMGVNLKVFMSVYIQNEVFIFDISLKAPQELLNAKQCFYPLCSREFVRRIVFRVMESVPFECSEWYPKYGRALSDGQFRNIFGISQRDMVISSPQEMGITGENIFSDGAEMFRIMGIDDSIIIPLMKAGDENVGNYREL
ncbi:MAG: hypothetical protein ACI4KF_08930 [Huintestinicola sp.]